MAHKTNSSRSHSIWTYHRYQLPIKFYPTFFAQVYFFTQMKLLTIICVDTDITTVHIFCLHQILHYNGKIIQFQRRFSIIFSLGVKPDLSQGGRNIFSAPHYENGVLRISGPKRGM